MGTVAMTEPQQPDISHHSIREPRQEELEEVVAFARAQGGEIDPAQVRTRLSLIARDPATGEFRGAALCLPGDHGSIRFELVIPCASSTASEPETPPDEAESERPSGSDSAQTALAQCLIDKALGKMRCARIGRCVIHMHHPDAARSLWHAARWTADTAPAPA